MQALPFEVQLELKGWTLFWAQLGAQPSSEAALTVLTREVAEQVRRELKRETLASHPTVAALRKLFKAAGCDPSRYRPSSEVLLRRLLKGEELPAILPLVDLNNCLSALLAVPCCVMAEGKVRPPFVFRVGRPGESYESLRGPFNLEAKPLLVDAEGPCDAPISGSERVKVTEDVHHAWLVAYLPTGTVQPEEAERTLLDLVAAAPVAHVRLTAAT